MLIHYRENSPPPPFLSYLNSQASNRDIFVCFVFVLVRENVCWFLERREWGGRVLGAAGLMQVWGTWTPRIKSDHHVRLLKNYSPLNSEETTQIFAINCSVSLGKGRLEKSAFDHVEPEKL